MDLVWSLITIGFILLIIDTAISLYHKFLFFRCEMRCKENEENQEE